MNTPTAVQAVHHALRNVDLHSCRKVVFSFYATFTPILYAGFEIDLFFSFLLRRLATKRITVQIPFIVIWVRGAVRSATVLLVVAAH